jgi:hypothetical protein
MAPAASKSAPITIFLRFVYVGYKATKLKSSQTKGNKSLTAKDIKDLHEDIRILSMLSCSPKTSNMFYSEVFPGTIDMFWEEQSSNKVREMINMASIIINISSHS